MPAEKKDEGPKRRLLDKARSVGLHSLTDDDIQSVNITTPAHLVRGKSRLLRSTVLGDETLYEDDEEPDIYISADADPGDPIEVVGIQIIFD